eukprot:541522-Pleurochrysis_carterae.AAC.1
MHHHFCANNEKTAHAAADPGGPGTSLCANCSGLLSDDGDESGERKDSGCEAGGETELVSAPVDVPALEDEQAATAIDSIESLADPHPSEEEVAKGADDEGVAEDGVDAEPQVPDEQDVPDINTGEDSNRLSSADLALEGTGDAGVTAPVIQCNRRIRVASRPDGGPRTGLVFALADGRAIIGFDDR